jgi:hypothetical protein
MNDHAIDNPFRWYESALLQIAYNYGRVQENKNIITDIDFETWMNFINLFSQFNDSQIKFSNYDEIEN